MSGGIVTSNFEERVDSARAANHMNMIQERIRAALMLKGKEYTGVGLDGEFYSKPERVIIGTHKGPMLAKFKESNPCIEVRHEVKKVRGEGKNSLVGKQSVQLDWFSNSCEIFLDPKSGRGRQDEVGWSDMGVDYNKSGSIFATITEWLPQMGLSEVDSVTMSGLLDGLSGKDDYTFMMMKAVLTLRMLSVGYSVEGAKFQGASKLPEYVLGDKKDKVGVIGTHECTIDLDCLTDTEALVAMMSSMQYPSIRCMSPEGDICTYGNISMPECDVQFVSGEKRVFNKMVPTPEKWWKAVIGLASKLGAVDNLITAFRATRGLAAWSVGLSELGFEEYDMTIDVCGTRGCRSVLTDSTLARVDKVVEPTNLVCSLGELLCDWACGIEMINMLFHVCDEFGLANKDINRNVVGLANCSVGDSILREAGFYDFGRNNTFYVEMMKRVDHRVQFLGDEHIKTLIQSVSEEMLAGFSEQPKLREDLLKVKNLGFTNYYGPMWTQNATVASRLEGTITSKTWGATSKSKKEVFYLRMWMDINGLSEKPLLYGGFNAVQKLGLEAISQTSMSKVQGAHGVYSETYREVNWVDEYEVRVGSETREKDRLDFVKTYLGMESDGVVESEIEVSEKVAPEPVRKEGFRGTLGAEGEEVRTEETTGDRAASGIGTGSVPEAEVDVTIRAGRRQPGNNRTTGRVGSRIGESFGTRGVGGFSRSVSGEGAKYKMKRVAGDGYCVATALATAMRDKGIAVTNAEVIRYLQREQNEPNFFRVEDAALLMQRAGVGVAIYDLRNNSLYGVGTEGRDPGDVVGITYDGFHCNALISGEDYDTLIDSGVRMAEKGVDESLELLNAIFGERQAG